VSAWWWVLIYGVIAIGAGIVFGVIGLGVWRKAKVLMTELHALAETTGRLEAALAPMSSMGDQPWADDHRGRHSSGRHDYLR
jgi:hypothetical protein